MILRDIFRLLTPYTASSSYTLPELATIAIDRDRAYASDGISSISTSLSGSIPVGLCVKAGPVSSWLSTLDPGGHVVAALIDRRLELGYRESISHPETAECAFATSPLSSYRVEVPADLRGDLLCELPDTFALSEALSYVLKRSGTDSTFQWASGVTLAFGQGSIRAYMTDNITMAMAGCPARAGSPRTVMITHGAAQRLQALMASVPGEAVFHLEEGRLLVKVDTVVFSTVTVADAAELENFLQHARPFADLDTFDPSSEFISAVQRHGQFAGREGAGTTIRIESGVATIFTSNEGGRIKDRAPLPGGHPDVTICTGASVLARMLGDGAQLRITEDAILTRSIDTGNCALLCAWDDQEGV
jgi:hypothetical protein